jgi:hypothetical protein
LVERVPNTSPALVQDVRVDHCRTHVAMPEQILDRSDVVPSFEQMCGEGVTQRMTRGWPGNAGGSRSVLHRPL